MEGKNKTALLTRATIFNKDLKKNLEEIGYNVIEHNLINYKLIPYNLEDIKNYNNLIITSYFAALNLPRGKSESPLIWVVGNNSGQIIAEKGYKIAFITDSASSLKAEILKSSPQNMLYLSGNQITVEMPEYIIRKIFYEVEYNTRLNSKNAESWKKDINYVLLFSKNCATVFLKILQEYKLQDYFISTKFLVISENVASVINKYYPDISIVGNSDSMFKYLKEENDRD